jgi:glycosyltransferase involved in cell wall biosynthesis
MRIALIYLGRRGAGGPISFALATHLARQADVLAILSENAANLPDWQASGLELITVPTYLNMSQAVWSWVNQANFSRLAARIRAWKPDIQFYPMFYTWNPFLQWHLRDIPSLVAVHDPQPHPGLADRVFRIMEDRSIHQATRCLVFSQAMAPALQKRGVSPDKMDAIPLGELPYSPSTIQTRPATEAPTLLFFGRITVYKGLDVLLKAFLKLRQQNTIRLLIVGDGDIHPYLPLLRQAPEVELINRWIEENEIPAFFSQASMVVLPYTSASQSGVLPVAASFGLPVIATRVGGIPEQIDDGRTGLLVEPGSVEGLSSAIQRLLEHPELAYSLGENLRAEYRQHRNWDQIAAQIHRICEQAVGA